MSAYERSYDGRETHTVDVQGEERDLPIVEIADGIYIASDADVVLGDTSFIDAAAVALADEIPAQSIDYLVTPEAKALPVTHALAQETGLTYVVVRKSVKGYMREPLRGTVDSITTDREQHLVLDGRDATRVADARVAIVDDAVSTGETMAAVEDLLADAGADVVMRAAIFEEGRPHPDVRTLRSLPIFRREKP